MTGFFRPVPRALLLLAPVGLSAGLLLCCVKKGPDAPGETRPAEPTLAAAALPVVSDGPWRDQTRSAEERTELLLAQMTQEEKFTLLFGYFGAPQGWRGYTPPPEARWGSAGYVPGVPRLGIPPQWQTDAGVGVATQGSSERKRERTALPSGLALASTWNPELVRAGGEMIGNEARADGFNVMLAGGVNLLRDAYNGRNFEYAGEDPWLAGTIVGKAIEGIQANHIICTVKHFALNDQETDRKAGNSLLAHPAAHESDLLAFELAIEHGRPGAVMCAYNKVDGVYSCESPHLLTQILRKDWGFQGYVMSDWGATHSAARAAQAGLDQQTGWPFDEQPYFQAPLREAIERGELPASQLNLMAGRILRSMFEHGLFDVPVQAGGEIPFERHASISQAAAEEGIVLLKNAGRLLPLARETASIAVIGGYADRGVLSGGGSSQVYPPGGNAVPGLAPQHWPGPVVYYPSSPLQELQRLLPHTKITFADGASPEKAAHLARQSHVAVVFATQWATEDIDTSITLPDHQDELIQAVVTANPKTVVVLETGGPVLTPWAHQVPAVVEAWYPGLRGGRAIARILVGDVNPSGHLAATFPASPSQLAHPHPPRAGDVVYAEGAAVGYKWFDKQEQVPQFAFGHGLSYTEFVLRDFEVKRDGSSVRAEVTVQNVGQRSGKQVVQLYVAGPEFEAPRRLAAYRKLDLAPGASQRVELAVDPRLLARWEEQPRGFVIAPGAYDFFVGQSSRELTSPLRLELPRQALAGGRRAEAETPAPPHP